VQAPAPPRLIEGGIPTERLVADVVVSKYADHLPLYRQAQIFARQGINLDRSTLASWVGAAAAELEPLYDHMLTILKGMDKLFADETRCPVLDPGRGKTKPGYFWALACDDRPWGASTPPAVIYSYAPGRGGKYAEKLLEGFSGVLQVDGYDGYNILTRSDRVDGAVTLAYCWAHYLVSVFMLSDVLTPQFWPRTFGRRSPHKFLSLKAPEGTRAGLAWASKARPERARCLRVPRSFRAHRVSSGGLWPDIDWSSQRWCARDSRG
jgi:hypothetical protein